MSTLNYPGDCTRFDAGRILGPDLFGAFYRPTSAAFDASANRTAITLKPIPPAELQGIVEADRARTFAKLDQIAGIAELFGSVI